MGRCACAHVCAPVRARNEVCEGTYEIEKTTVMRGGGGQRKIQVDRAWESRAPGSDV